MAGFLYYLPGRTADVSDAELKTLGLGYALDGALTKVGVTGGPDGGNGVLVARAESVEPLGYFPDRQTWRKIPRAEGGGRKAAESDIWVGMYQDQIPDSQSLARAKQLDGHEVQLGDDCYWLVPIARGWLEQDGELRWYVKLPQRSVLGDNGQWDEGSVVERYAPLWELAMAYQDARRGAFANAEASADGQTVRIAFDFNGLHEGAIRALQENYRIGAVEADMLGLLTLGISREILEALIDIPTSKAWFNKKKQSAAPAAGSNTGGGSPAATPATAPPAPISGH